MMSKLESAAAMAVHAASASGHGTTAEHNRRQSVHCWPFSMNAPHVCVGAGPFGRSVLREDLFRKVRSKVERC